MYCREIRNKERFKKRTQENLAIQFIQNVGPTLYIIFDKFNYSRVTNSWQKHTNEYSNINTVELFA